MCSASPSSTYLSMRPARIVHDGELPPDRIVGNEFVAVERLLEYVLADDARFPVAQMAEARALESRGVHLDDEGAGVRRVAVMVRVEGAELGLRRKSATAFRSAWPCRTRRSGWSRGARSAPNSSARLRRTSELTPSAPTTRSKPSSSLEVLHGASINRQRRPRSPRAPASSCNSCRRPMAEKPMPSMTTRSPRKLSAMSSQDSVRGTIAA